MGYVEETGVAQYLRDSRIAPIYEGTNGIQAIDLVTRKVPMRGGGVVTDLRAQMEVLGRELAASPELAGVRSALGNGVSTLREATDCPDQFRAWNGSMSCSPTSSRISPAESSCSTGTGRPSRPVRPAASLREGNLARPARTSQIVSTTPMLTRWVSGAW